ncbi:MAG: CoA transferase, partial [Gammaproteobacteria bacterium]|nr:CoA transferase [Gammaproteobacteria bacterium]
SDGKYISICALEDKFHQSLMDRLGIDKDTLPDHRDSANWPALHDRIAGIVKTRSRHEWCEMLEGSDACVSPVLNLREAPDHPANRERSSYAIVDGVLQAAPAPRFSRTESNIDHAAPKLGEHTYQILREIGIDAAKIEGLIGEGTVFDCDRSINPRSSNQAT